MASTKEYRDFVIEQLHELKDIKYKPMMGEYLLYYKGILFGGIYDNRLLVKKTENNKKYQMKEAIPYQNSKTMYLIEDFEHQEVLKNIILDSCNRKEE